MKTKFFLVCAMFLLMVLFASISWNYVASGNSDHKNHSILNQGKPDPKVDGSRNPELIPDVAAYEILFRMLSSSTPEAKKEQRKSAYLRVSGFNEAEAAAISNAAHEYKRLIEPLDTAADNIKNVHWPNSSQQAMDQLAQLEAQKEGIINNIATGLKNQLSNYNPSKFSKHLTDDIKRKTKGFASGLPLKKVSGIRQRFSNLFAASAQSCDANTYVYSSTVVDMPGLAVYANGSWSMPYNNCNHVITLSTTLQGAGSASGGDGAYFNLDVGSYFVDGYFLSTTSADAFCPVANANSYAGSNSSDATVEPFVQVVRLYANNANVNPNVAVTLTAEVKASETASGAVSVQFGISSNPSPITFTDTFPRSASGTLSNYAVTLQTIAAPPASATKKGPVIFYAGLSAVPVGTVANGNALNTTVCWGPGPGSSCPIE